MQFYFFCVCGDVLSFINSMQNFKTFHKNCFNAQDGWEKKLHTKEFQQKGSITRKHEMQVPSKEKNPIKLAYILAFVEIVLYLSVDCLKVWEMRILFSIYTYIRM